MAPFSSRLGQEKGGSNGRGPTGTLKHEQEKSSSLNPRSYGFNRVGQTPLPLQLGPGMWAQSQEEPSGRFQGSRKGRGNRLSGRNSEKQLPKADYEHLGSLQS